MGLVTFTFDLLTLKRVRESHQRWGTFVPNLGTLGLWVLKLFAIYVTDGWTDGRTKATLKSKVKVKYANLYSVSSRSASNALPLPVSRR